MFTKGKNNVKSVKNPLKTMDGYALKDFINVSSCKNTHICKLDFKQNRSQNVKNDL